METPLLVAISKRVARKGSSSVVRVDEAVLVDGLRSGYQSPLYEILIDRFRRPSCYNRPADGRSVGRC